jgi:uncharacterized protein involved in high-affinity Fe2+ transport
MVLVYFGKAALSSVSHIMHMETDFKSVPGNQVGFGDGFEIRPWETTSIL